MAPEDMDGVLLGEQEQTMGEEFGWESTFAPGGTRRESEWQYLPLTERRKKEKENHHAWGTFRYVDGGECWWRM